MQISHEKGISIDMARKFYSIEWINKMVDYMAELGMNTLNLHFSDNQGFRIQCDTFPQTVSEQHWTKDEVRALIAKCKSLGIQIIPEFDAPGHLYQILKSFPQYIAPDLRDDTVEGFAHMKNNGLDISNPEAVDFIKKFYKEYAELFADSKYFHIGADEYFTFENPETVPQLTAYAKEKYGPEADAIDAFVAFVNDIAAYIKELGFIPRAWSDGFYRKNRNGVVELDKDIQICYWTKWHKDMATPEDFLEKGHKLVNFCDNFFYYVLGENAGYTYPTYEKINSEWTVKRFPHNQEMSEENFKNVLGTSFSIWSDKPEAQTEQEVWDGVKGPLKAMMEILNQNIPTEVK